MTPIPALMKMPLYERFKRERAEFVRPLYIGHPRVRIEHPLQTRRLNLAKKTRTNIALVSSDVEIADETDAHWRVVYDEIVHQTIDYSALVICRTETENVSLSSC